MEQRPLTDLRSDLARLVLMRAAVRTARATLTFSLILIGAVVFVFSIDWIFHLSIMSRLIVLTLCGVVLVMAALRGFLILLRTRESIEDVALIVEKHHAIDSDLVAALQFDTAPPGAWGSSDLSNALVAHVAGRAKSLNVFHGFSLDGIPKQAGLVALLSIAVFIFAFCESDIARVFGSRLLLEEAHYPTRTSIKSILVNNQEVSGVENRRLSIPFGQSVKFEIASNGVTPKTAYARLFTSADRLTDHIELKPTSHPRRAFNGELRKMIEPFSVTFHLGDAVSTPVHVDLIPLPMVNIDWDIIPPRYALEAGDRHPDDQHNNVISALEGSAVRFRLNCLNKRLVSATVKIGGAKYDMVTLQDAGEAQPVWGPPSETLFASIRDSWTYEIQVIDTDGLSLERPITGLVRKRTDIEPQVTCTTVTHYVLPSAQPKIDYIATDDFGVKQIRAIVEVQREDGRTANRMIAAREFPDSDQPKRRVPGQMTIPLSEYELLKGDTVKVTLEVTDWRGDSTGRAHTGDSVTFQVTDLAEVLSRIAEEDKKAVEKLEEIIKAARARQ